VYPAGEAPIAGATGQALARAMGAHGHRDARYAVSREQLVLDLAEMAKPGDCLIALGAGDVNQVLAPLAERLALKSAENNTGSGKSGGKS
jgi:UDP-N-acetylmuramate--alanine ligase